MEEWKDIKGYEGLYQVSNLGRVKNIKTNRILKKWINTNDTYFRVTLYNNGSKKHFLLHRLLAIHFIPNPDNLPEVCHKDNNKQNFSLDNLEWGSKSYNSQCAYDTGVHVGMKGEKHPMHKLTEKQVQEIRAKYIPWKYSTRKLAKEYNIHQSVIFSIVNNDIWKEVNYA